jgi:transcriptional regulator with XRE-family HTH domain
VATRERPVDRGQRLGRAPLLRIGSELRTARTGAGLSIDVVAAALGISNAEVSRIERAQSAKVSLITLARFAPVVGLDFVASVYPGPGAIRDQPQAQLLGDFSSCLHASLGWATEVPLPIPGDQRAWDGMITGVGWRFGVEAETAPRDGQAVTRRLALKLRDGEVDGLILLVRDTNRTRAFIDEAREALASMFPTPARQALSSLRAGRCPVGNALIVVPYRGRLRPAHTSHV